MNDPADEIRANLQNLGRQIKAQLPKEFGFILLVPEYGESGTMLYTASVSRLDALQAMREFIAVNMEERVFQREMPEVESDHEFNVWWQAERKRSQISGQTHVHIDAVKRACRDAFLAGRSTA